MYIFILRQPCLSGDYAEASSEQHGEDEHIACCGTKQGIERGTVAMCEAVPGDGVQYQVESRDSKHPQRGGKP